MADARWPSRLRRIGASGARRLGRLVERPFAELSDGQAVRMAYNVLLRREPDASGRAHFLGGLASGELGREDVLDHLRWSPEFHHGVPVRDSQLGHSLHLSRSEFIIGLPEAKCILDLGGSSSYSQWGAMVVMGYPYRFESLTIIDLPPDDRHEIYRYPDAPAEVESPNGPVRYAYHSMADLARYGDASVDLVYSGQSIEHVAPAEADHVLGEVHRVLRPGGHLALDTPNARACRAQQAEFIDPDHKVEYTHGEMAAKLEAAGFTIREAKGLNYVGRSLESGTFSITEAAVNAGIYAEPQDCYLLAYLCQKR